jgi:ACS family tartrate transporter-like MFS transporter
MEGLPAILLGIVAFFFLTDWPSEARWLTTEQQQWISHRLDEEKPSNRESLSLRQALRSRPGLLLAAAAFLDYFAGYAVIFWLPTVLKAQSGFSDLRVGMFGALPYAVALIAMLFNGWHSDRSRERRWHAAVPLFITAGGLLGLSSLPSSSSIMIIFFSMACMYMAFLPAFWAIPTEILSESTAAVAVGMINALASVAGFAGPYAFGYLHTRTGSLAAGFAVLMCCAFAAAILMLLMPAAERAQKKTEH